MFASAVSILLRGPTESTIEEDCPILLALDADDFIMDTPSALGSGCEPTEGTLEERWLQSLPDINSVAMKDASASDSSPCGPTNNAQDVQQEFPPRHWELCWELVAPSPFIGLSGLEELDMHTPDGSEDVTMQALSEISQAPEQTWKKTAIEEVIELWPVMNVYYFDPRDYFTTEMAERERREREITEITEMFAKIGKFDNGLRRALDDSIDQPRWREQQRRLREESIRLDKTSKALKNLFDLLKTLWVLLDTIIELMQTVRVYIILILNTVSSGFSEFPNSMRPPCTTMPWTIWPSLVVLWGVCWMFYTPMNPARERQLQLSLQDAEWGPFLSSEVLFDPLEAQFLKRQDISEYSALEDLNALPSSFNWSSEIDFTQFSASGNSKRVDIARFEQSAPSRSLEQGTSSDFIWAGNIVEQPPVTTPIDNYWTVPWPNEGLAMALGARTSSQAEQTSLTSQPSMTSTRLKQPPRHSDDEIVCDHVDCNNKNIIFTTIRDWSKHKNKHERPYKCTMKDCTRTQGFATKGDQLRHERIVHKTPNSGVNVQDSISTLFCDEPNCARGPGTGNAGFHRKDNLMDHLKRRHGRGMASSRVSATEVRSVSSSMPPDNQSPALPQLEGQQMISLVALPGKLRRVPATQTPDTADVEDANPRKKQRREDHGENSDIERTLREQALTREVEKLRKELEKSQREKDVLIGVIDRLTRDRE